MKYIKKPVGIADHEKESKNDFQNLFVKKICPHCKSKYWVYRKKNFYMRCPICYKEWKEITEAYLQKTGKSRL